MGAADGTDGAGAGRVLGQGRDSALEGPCLAAGGGRLLLGRQGHDAERPQQLTLPFHQALPVGMLTVLAKPSSDVHAMNGDAGQDVGPAVFVA